MPEVSASPLDQRPCRLQSDYKYSPAGMVVDSAHTRWEAVEKEPLLPVSELHERSDCGDERKGPARGNCGRRLLIIMASLILTLAALVGVPALHSSAKSCDSVNAGYHCRQDISHLWGQYSPYFTVPSDIDADVPAQCAITFALTLGRHGARDPTSSKTTAYNATIQQIHDNVSKYPPKYAFLKTYEYTLGADQLTQFGQQEMYNSGIKFYNRYQTLARQYTPFVRASGEDRVVASAENFTQGFHSTKLSDNSSDAYPYDIVVISEAAGSNNTMEHGLCTAFEEGPASEVSGAAQATFTRVFVPPIQARLNADLVGANLSATQTIYMMDMCSFNTVASVTGQVSDFCGLFSAAEWQSYNYYQSLGKYYGYGSGNPLGPTQGVGYVNELIARLTGQPVDDHTTVNHTLDRSAATFPLGPDFPLFADFSHDNSLTSIFAALGLYNQTLPLSNTTVATTPATHGFSAAWTVPFAARAYVEKMRCRGHADELVRIVVNDRVTPLQNCGADALGRCTLSRFVESLSFARAGGLWDQCWA